MRVTTKGRYAVRAVLNLALSSGDDPVPIKKIAKEEGISPEFLEQIFFRLKKTGLIRSVRGPGGGFLLNRKAEEISIKEIFESVGEGLDLTPCTVCAEDADECERQPICRVFFLWNAVSTKINDYLDGISIDSIIRRKFE
jgi:Rrf2 family transcriptional regulator, iron-sulfur cluster assembly transcription factor